VIPDGEGNKYFTECAIPKCDLDQMLLIDGKCKFCKRGFKADPTDNKKSCVPIPNWNDI